MTRSRLLGAAILLCSTSFALAAGTVSVSQQGRSFLVKHVDLVRGGSLRVSNDDEFVHQIYVEAASFSYESDEQAPGQAIEVRFPVAGSFEVRCHIHPKMLLQVDVH